MAYPTQRTGRTIRSRLFICPAMTIFKHLVKRQATVEGKTQRTGSDGHDKREWQQVDLSHRRD